MGLERANAGAPPALISKKRGPFEPEKDGVWKYRCLSITYVRMYANKRYLGFSDKRRICRMRLRYVCGQASA